MRLVNGKPIRKRGGKTTDSNEVDRDMRPSALRHMMPVSPADTPMPTKVACETGKYRKICLEVEETREGYLIPRKSLSQQQYLGARDPIVETEPIVTRQLDKANPFNADGTPNLITTTDERVTWKSEKTLLNTSGPDTLQRIDFRRRTSRSKRLIRQPEERENPYVLIEYDTDLD